MKQALLKEGSETLALTDVTGIKLTKAFVDKAKEVTAALEKTPGWEDPVYRGHNGAAEGSSSAV